MELTLEISNICNRNCAWCSSSASASGYEVAPHTILAQLSKYKPQCDTVRISGGEPTLHGDLCSIVWEAHNMGYKVVLLSNGSELYIHDGISAYNIGIVDEASIRTSRELSKRDKQILMHAVLVKGNEFAIKRAMQVSLEDNIPLRLVRLQKQGRGADCEPLDTITWTGFNGCTKNDKISILYDSKVITCSALKEGNCSFNCGIRKEQL